MSNLSAWLHDSERTHHRWLGAPTVVVAWFGLFLAAFSPPEGTGVPLCWVNSTTGLPCIGCGLTRSMSCALRGMFLESLKFHPLGLMVLCVLLIAAASSLLPQSANTRIQQAMASRPFFFNSIYLSFVSILVGYGMVRGALVFLLSFGFQR